jgi:hypothetical protein
LLNHVLNDRGSAIAESVATTHLRETAARKQACYPPCAPQGSIDGSHPKNGSYHGAVIPLLFNTER